MSNFIELRSDTFTKPTPEMLNAMFLAPVGDDVFEEDPSINELENKVAQFFGMEKAIFCPTGTMSNQIGIKCHTQPGHEVITEQSSHVYLYEGGGIAVNSGCQVKLLQGVNGKLEATQIGNAINPDDIHKPISSLVSLENTTNRGGGFCYEISDLWAIKKVCEISDLKLHLDGARLWNALVAKKQNAKDYGKIFDSISVCFNKGMGCPIGSVLLGNNDYIKKARRIRKVFGGGMRQGGYMAAACIYALENNIERLSKDHMHTHMLAEAINGNELISDIATVETNIIIISFKNSNGGKLAVDYLAKNGIKCLSLAANQIRLVTHLDVSKSDIEKSCKVLSSMQF